MESGAELYHKSHQLHCSVWDSGICGLEHGSVP